MSAGRQDFDGRRSCHHPSLIDESHQLGDASQIFRRVDGDEHRQPLVATQAVDERDHLAAQSGIEAAKRLVEEHQRAFSDERASDCHPLALASGKLRRPAPAKPGKADALKRGLDLAYLSVREPKPRINTEADILSRREMREKIVVLEEDGERTLTRFKRKKIASSEVERA